MQTKTITALFLLVFYCSISFSQSAISWSTYYGGTLFDGSNSIATDTSGNVYIAGSTNSTTDIASSGFQNTLGGGYDAFLTKFDASGNRLWSTYYGGAGDESGYGVTVDMAGNIYLQGKTNSTSGIASGGFQNTFGGGSDDAFLVKFNSAGNRLWATYYGGPGSEVNYNFTTDASSNVYITGFTTSTSGIASTGFQNSYGGGAHDAFLVKFDPSGNRLWATYYGGIDDSRGYGVSTDSSNNIYMTGYTNDVSNIAFAGYQNTYGGGSFDAFLVKFDSTGSRIWATYYGGAGDDEGYCLNHDDAGNIYVAGYTTSIVGISFGGFQNTYGGGTNDGFLVKFNPLGNRQWATYYGGSGFDYFDAIESDATGNIYVAGITGSNSSIASGGFQNTYGGGIYDAFFVKFNSAGNRVGSTYHGNSGDEVGNAIAVDNSGSIYMTGYTNSIAGMSFGGFQNTYGGGIDDAYLVKYNNVVGVPETDAIKLFDVFPNPAVSELTLTFNKIAEYNVLLFNALGNEILKTTIHSDEMNLNINDYPVGIYYVVVRDKKNNLTAKKILKQ